MTTLPHKSVRILSALILLIFGIVAAGSCTKRAVKGGSQSQQQFQSAESFRLMSYNIHHGEGMDGQVDLERIAGVIRRAGADIVALQEVDVGVERSGRIDIACKLAELTDLKYYAFGKNLDHQGGAYGNATLSKYPIVEETNTHFTKIGPEQRGVLQTVMEVEGHSLLLLNTHLDYRSNDEERLVSVKELQEQVLREYDTEAVMVAGDFNDFPGSTAHQRMKAFMSDAWEMAGEGDGFTISPDEPSRRIDYIFHNEGLRVSKAWVPKTMASDHLPVVVEFYFHE